MFNLSCKKYWHQMFQCSQCCKMEKTNRITINNFFFFFKQRNFNWIEQNFFFLLAGRHLLLRLKDGPHFQNMDKMLFDNQIIMFPFTPTVENKMRQLAKSCTRWSLFFLQLFFFVISSYKDVKKRKKVRIKFPPLSAPYKSNGKDIKGFFLWNI